MKLAKSLVLALGVLLMASGVFAQENVTLNTVKTTESMGTVSQISPDAIVIRTETSSDPLNYSYTKSTTYVDETGTPVSIETVKSGLPVTVYYTREGDRLIANKVVVKKHTTTTGNPAYEETRTKTTTTTTQSR